MEDPFFKLPPPKSTGKDYFNLAWLQGRLSHIDSTVEAVHVQSTLLEFTALSVRNAITHDANDSREVLVCGGGTHNPVLINRLNTLIPGMDFCSTDKYGVNPDAVEAIAFAWLAWRRLEKLPGNLPEVTGAKRPVLLGAIYQA